MSDGINLCAVIPIYNHPDYLTILVEEFEASNVPIILVDDGSEDHCRRVIDNVVEQFQTVHLERHEVNRGKGAAIKSGLRAALEQNFTHALQIDADGQHAVNDVPKFVAAMKRHPQALIAGYPCYDNSIPRHRYYGRYASHIWVWINTLSTTIIDSMCCFRIYPVAESVLLINSEKVGDRMDFDGEFIVRWFWTRQPLKQIGTHVIYPQNGVSHFQLFNDNRLITWMHTRLFFGMLRRLPMLLQRKWRA